MTIYKTICGKYTVDFSQTTGNAPKTSMTSALYVTPPKGVATLKNISRYMSAHAIKQRAIATGADAWRFNTFSLAVYDTKTKVGVYIIRSDGHPIKINYGDMLTKRHDRIYDYSYDNLEKAIRIGDPDHNFTVVSLVSYLHLCEQLYNNNYVEFYQCFVARYFPCFTSYSLFENWLLNSSKFVSLMGPSVYTQQYGNDNIYDLHKKAALLDKVNYKIDSVRNIMIVPRFPLYVKAKKPIPTELKYDYDTATVRVSSDNIYLDLNTFTHKAITPKLDEFITDILSNVLLVDREAPSDIIQYDLSYDDAEYTILLDTELPTNFQTMLSILSPYKESPDFFRDIKFITAKSSLEYAFCNIAYQDVVDVGVYVTVPRLNYLARCKTVNTAAKTLLTTASGILANNLDYVSKILTVLLTTDMPNMDPIQLSSTDSKLRKLRAYDPVTYSFSKSVTSGHSYSKLCQHKFHPTILSKDEYDNTKDKDEVVTTVNKTTNGPAYYRCDNPEAPYLGAIPGEHPEGHCVWCCRVAPQENKPHHQACLNGECPEVGRNKSSNAYIKRNPDANHKFLIQDEFLNPLLHQFVTDGKFYHKGIFTTLPEENILVLLPNWLVDVSMYDSSNDSVQLFYYSSHTEEYYQIVLVDENNVFHKVFNKSYEFVKRIVTAYSNNTLRRVGDDSRTDYKDVTYLCTSNSNAIAIIDTKKNVYIPITKKKIAHDVKKINDVFDPLISKVKMSTVTEWWSKSIATFIINSVTDTTSALKLTNGRYVYFCETPKEEIPTQYLTVEFAYDIRMLWSNEYATYTEDIVTIGNCKYYENMFKLFCMEIYASFSTNINTEVRAAIADRLIGKKVDVPLSPADSAKLFHIINVDPFLKSINKNTTKEAIVVHFINMYDQFDFDRTTFYQFIKTCTYESLETYTDGFIEWTMTIPQANCTTFIPSKYINEDVFYINNHKLVLPLSYKKYLIHKFVDLCTDNLYFRQMVLVDDSNIVS